MTAPTTEITRLGLYNISIEDVSYTFVGPDHYGYAEALPQALNDVSAVANWIATTLTDELIAAIEGAEEISAISAQIVIVAGIATEVQTVAGLSTEITALNAISAAISTVAARDADVGTVADRDADIGTVAGLSIPLQIVALISEDVGTVAASAADVGTVATNIADVNTAADNIAAIIAVPGYLESVRQAGLYWVYDTTTTDADPGSGKFRLNNAAVGSATVMYIDLLTGLGGDATDWIASWDDSTSTGNRGELTLIKADEAGVWAKFTISGANTDPSGYRKIALTYIDHVGTFTNADEFVFIFARSGNKGEDGSGSGDVVGPAGSGENRVAVFDDTTGKLLADGGNTIAEILDTDNHTNGTTNKVFAATDKAKLDHLTVTQAVDLDAIETRVNALDAAVVLKGTWDASAGTFPGSGVAQAGESWIVSVAGTVNSVAFAIGDRIIAITDNASTSTFAANWFKADYTDQLSSVAGLTGTPNAAAVKTALAIVLADIGDASANGRSLISAADYPAMRTLLGLVIGTNVLAYDAGVAPVKGKQAISIPAAAMVARTTNGAASFSTELATNDVMIRGFDFDTSTAEGVQALFSLPKQWDEGTVSFRYYWTAGSGSGGVAFSLRARAASDDDAMDGSWGTAVTVTDTFIAANDMHVTAESGAITIGGSPAEGDMIWIEVQREVANGSDTLAVDARLLGIEFFITTNAGTDA